MCLKEEFKNYLIFNKLSAASVKKYSEQVPSFIKKNFGIDIYEYSNVKELENFIQTIKKDTSFVEANKLPLANASGITCSELRSPCPKASQA